MDIPGDKLAEWLSCPICLEIPSGPIFQCQTGHTVCDNCRDKIQTCPICKSPMTDTKNFLAQEMAQKVTVTCKYEGFGCAVKMPGSARRKHQEDCKFRPQKCPILSRSNCTQEVSQETLLEHVLKMHSAMSVPVSGTSSNTFSQEIPFDIANGPCLLVERLPPIVHLRKRNQEEDYLFVMDIDNDGNPSWSFYVLSSKLSSQYFWATITFQNPATRVAISWTAPARSVRKTAEEISVLGDCLTMHGNNFFRAISHYNESTLHMEWNVIISFHGTGDNNGPVATTVPILQSVPQQSTPEPSTKPCSSTSSTNKKLEKVNSSKELDHRPWPFSAAPDKTIKIAVEGIFTGQRCSAGVCLILGKNKPALYSCFRNSFNGGVRVTASTDLEFQALTAVTAIKEFKKFFTPGTKIHMAFPVNLFGDGKIAGGSFVGMLKHQLQELSSGGLSIASSFDKKSLETVAVKSLLISTKLCEDSLAKSGIRVVAEPGDGGLKQPSFAKPNVTVSSEQISNPKASACPQAISKTSVISGENNPSVSDSGKLVRIGVYGLHEEKRGGGICIIREKGKPSIYKTCVNLLSGFHIENRAEFEAFNASKSITKFKSFITPGSTVFLSCCQNITQTGTGIGNLYRQQLKNQIKAITTSRGNIPFTLLFGGQNSKKYLELVASKLLLDSEECCTDMLRKAGIQSVEELAAKQDVEDKTTLVPKQNSPFVSNRDSALLNTSQFGLTQNTPSSRLPTRTATCSSSIQRDEGLPSMPSNSNVTATIEGTECVINIGVKAIFDKKLGGGVCLIRGTTEVPVFVTCHTSLQYSNATNCEDFQAQNTLEVVKTIDEFLSFGSTVFISCAKRITRTDGGQYCTLLHKHLSKLVKSPRKLTFYFKALDAKSLESIGVSLLLYSQQLCDMELMKAGVRKLEEFKIEQQASQPETNTLDYQMVVASKSQNQEVIQPPISEVLESTPRKTSGAPSLQPFVLGGANQELHVGVLGNFESRNGYSAWILRTKGMAPAYKLTAHINSKFLKDSSAANSLEFQALLIRHTLKKNKFLTSGSILYISNPMNVSLQKTAQPNSQLDLLLKRLEAIAAGKGIKFYFTTNESKPLAMQAVELLQSSEEDCKNLLKQAGITEFSATQVGKTAEAVPLNSSTLRAVREINSHDVLPNNSDSPNLVIIPHPPFLEHTNSSMNENGEEACDEDKDNVPWPFSADPSKVINIGVHADFDWKFAGGVCIIRGNNMDPFYSTCEPALQDSVAKTNTEFQAENAHQVLEKFQVYFTPGATINISCQCPKISTPGPVGSYSHKLHEVLDSLKKSHGITFQFTEYNYKNIETIAVDSLLTSPAICAIELRKAGIQKSFDLMR